jgi:hypothetical protein
MTRDMTNEGVGRRNWIGGVVFAAIVGLVLAGVAVRAGDGDARSAKPWTRTVQLRLSPQRLGLPASTSARRLARAALSRSARRLGLPR